MNDKSSVFVLMPFDEEFTPVYEQFFKPVLEEAGFNVLRADDIQSQQNILRDVLERIVDSDLIIADLTNANPNVFYELGIAHAAKKPVVLATQNIEDVPFDLKSYRLVEYSVHFAKIGEAKQQLANYAEGFLKESIKFGNPFTDFYPGGETHSDTRGLAVGDTEAEAEDERGFLDHLVDINNGYSSIAMIINRITSDIQDLTDSTDTAAKELTAIGANPNTSSPRAAQRVSRRLADRIATFNQGLADANSEYTTIAQGLEDSLEFIVSFYWQQSEVTDPAVEEQISNLRNLRSSAIEGRDSFNALADTMDGLPRIERRLNREVARGSEEIRIMAGNIDKTIASISRALNYHD